MSLYSPLKFMMTKAGRNFLVAATLLVVIQAEISSGQPRRPPRQILPPGRGIFRGPFLPAPAPPPQFIPAPVILNGNQPIRNQPPVSLQSDVRIELSEKLLQSVLNRRESTTGDVQDFIMGAQVTGQQTTVSTVRINCVENTTGAVFNFEIDGISESATTSQTPQAEISHQANNRFRALKPVMFDGTKLLTKRTTIFVAPNQQVMGARSRHTGLPLFGKIADRIAYGAATAYSPQSNLISGQRLMQKLQPQIDSKTDKKLSLANDWLQKNIWMRLEQFKLQPMTRSAHSTDNSLMFQYKFSNAKSEIKPPENTAADARLLIHEQSISRILEQYPLTGKRISFNELIESTNLLLQKIDPSFQQDASTLPVEVNFTFAKTDPLQFSFQKAGLEIIMRGRFQLQALPETELHRIRLSFKSKLTEHQLILSSDVIDIREEQPDGKLSEPGFTQRAFMTQFATLLQPLHIKREISIPLGDEQQNGKKLTARLNRMTTNNGWIDLSWNVTDQPQETLPEIPPGSAPVPNSTIPPQPPLTFPKPQLTP